MTTSTKTRRRESLSLISNGDAFLIDRIIDRITK